MNFRRGAQAFIRFEAAASGGSIGEGQLRDIFTQTATAAQKFGLTAESQERIFLAYEQMISKGVVSMEELRRQLGDALPGAFQIGARAMGLTTREFGKLVESGDLLSSEFLPKFAKQLGKDVKGSADDLAVSFGQLTNAWDKFKNSVGEGIRPAAKMMSDTAGAVLRELTPNTANENAIKDAARSIAGERVGTTGLRGRAFSQVEINQRIAEMMLTDPSVMAEARVRAGRPALARQGMEGLQGLFGQAGSSLGGAFSGMFPDSNSKQDKSFNRFMRDASNDGLSGSSEVAANYQNRIALIKEAGLTWKQEEIAIKAVEDAQSRVLALNATERQTQMDSAWADEMKQMKDAAKELYFGTLEPGLEVEARIQDAFERDVALMLELEEAGQNLGVTYDDLIAKRERALNPPKNVKLQSGGREVGFDTVLDGWGTLDKRIGEVGAQTANTLEDGFSEAFTSMITGTQSVSEAFKNMGNSIISDLVRIMVQQMVVRSVMQAFGGFGGMTDQQGLQNIRNSYVSHSGGVVGEYGSQERRLHSGGVVGDEARVVARKGEVIFTPEQMGALGKAGGERAMQKVEVVNVMDQNYFADNLWRHKRAIINIIGSESKTVRRAVAS